MWPGLDPKGVHLEQQLYFKGRRGRHHSWERGDKGMEKVSKTPGKGLSAEAG